MIDRNPQHALGCYGCGQTAAECVFKVKPSPTRQARELLHKIEAKYFYSKPYDLGGRILIRVRYYLSDNVSHAAYHRIVGSTIKEES